MDSVILLVDIQSFYASIEKTLRPELKDKPVIVSGDPRRRNGVVLAACPLAKGFGIKNADTLWKAQTYCPDVVVVRPHMQLYLDASLRITNILERFSDEVEPYSIDEQFISVKGSQKLFGTPIEIASKIKNTIRNEIGVSARIGIGPNKVLSKMACDHFAKKNQSGIFCLTQQNMKQYLWPLPIGKMFGIGHRLNRHFQNMGICTIGQLAQFPLNKLTKKWGINGHVLWMTANGIDHSPVTKESFYGQKGIGHHMTLPRDYHHLEEINIVLLELCEEVCRRLRRKKLLGKIVTVSCRGNRFDFPSGFHRQIKMDPTNETMVTYQYVTKLFKQHWNGEPVRSLGVGLSNLCPDNLIQLSLFEERLKSMKIGYVMDDIKERFGPTAILRASSLTSAGQAQERALKIGGHYR